MLARTRKLWNKQHQLVGDRRELFTGIAGAVDANTVLYPGSYVDLTPAFIWPRVVFVDLDRRANQFFADGDGVAELVSENREDPSVAELDFIHGDYQMPLHLEDGSFDLLISLYAGFISEHCTRYLAVGGHLLVNSSHGDAAMASIDPRYELRGVVSSARGPVRSTDLESYLVPKRRIDVTKEYLHETGRGIGYTKPAFAYLFKRRA